MKRIRGWNVYCDTHSLYQMIVYVRMLSISLYVSLCVCVQVVNFFIIRFVLMKCQTFSQGQTSCSRFGMAAC